jgi:TolB protein
MAYRTLAPGQRAQIWIGGPGKIRPELLFETGEVLIEAPNWSLDGASLLLNGHGRLWRLGLDSPEHGLTLVDFEGLPELNNDHVLDPDGEHIYMSAMDGHIYRGALRGGAVDQVSPADGDWHFLHGVSPDGSRLAYVHIGDLADPGRLALMEPIVRRSSWTPDRGTLTDPSGRPTAGGSTSTQKASPTSPATLSLRGSRMGAGPWSA